MRKTWKRVLSACLVAAMVSTGSFYSVHAEEVPVADEIATEQVSEENTVTEAATDDAANVTTEASNETMTESAADTTEVSTEEVQQEAPTDTTVDAASPYALSFVYVEQETLESFETQNVVVSFASSVADASLIRLSYVLDGETKALAPTKVVDNLVLFEFVQPDAGTYDLTGVTLLVGDETVFVDFAAAEMSASFTVTQADLGMEGAVTGEVQQLTADGIGIGTCEVLSADRGSGPVIVVLDPGHDDTQHGAAGCGLREEQLNLKIAQACKAELETYNNVKVYMTRNDGSCLNPSSNGACLKARCNYAASVGAHLLVSIHVDAGSETGSGALAIVAKSGVYRDDLSAVTQASGQKILDELVKLGLPSRGFLIRMSDSTSSEFYYPNGAQADWYAITRNSIKAGIPGIIIEHGFISNPNDVARFLNTDEKLAALGVADATGIANYFGLTKGASAKKIADAMQDDSTELYTENNQDVSAFVASLYHSVFGRTPARWEVSYWVRKVGEEKLTGSALVLRFVNSREFQNRNYSDADYVEKLYEVFLGRASEPAGKAHWVGLLKKGVSRADVAKRIGNSPEFELVCASYGMAQGSHKLQYVKLYPRIADFVTDYYEGLLGRSPDAGGLEHWTGCLVRGEKTAADISRDFINSPEFRNRKLSKDVYVEGLYHTYLHRASDPSGKAYWKKKLPTMSTAEKETVIKGFIRSPEYASHCEQYGVVVGQY